jgi:hypothetical protein
MNKDQIRSALQQATTQPKRKSVTKDRFITNRKRKSIRVVMDTSKEDREEENDVWLCGGRGRARRCGCRDEEID